ncbi:MAG: hypothetical protein WB699_14600 [Bacteroidota bacterium]
MSPLNLPHPRDGHRPRGFACICLAIAILFLAGPAAGVAQQVRPVFQDSIDAVVGSPLFVKDHLRNWNANFASIRYRVTLFRDEKFRVALKEWKWSRDKNYANNPGDFNVRIVDTLRESGRFYLLRVARGPDERGVIEEASAYWIIDSHWPFLATSPVRSLDYGQSAFLNFAAGHGNYADYSYRVLRASDNDQVLGGRGPVVTVDSLWRIDEDLQDTAYVVEGLYDGRPFRYHDIAADSIEPSRWRVSVSVPPTPAGVTLWTPAPKPSDRLNLLDMAPQEGWLTSRQFRYIFETPIGASSIYVRPRTSRQVVRSVPDDFLLPGNPSSWTNLGDWRIVTLNVNPLYLRDKSSRRPGTVLVTIEFLDQWGQQFRQTYSARVFSSEYEK